MIDLHTHSTASDGSSTPTELADLARDAGLSAIALTDHDTVDGLMEATRRCRENGIILVPGVEIEVEFSPGEFHLLGLGLGDWEGRMRLFLEDLQRKRRGRNRQIIEKMTREGIEVTLEELDQRARGKITSRLHFAQWLIERGHARDIPDAFARWLGPGKPFYVPKVRPTLEEALGAIHDAGGKAIIAHPLSLWVSWGRLGSLLPEWAEAGLDGIEAWHPGADKRQGERFAALAQKNNLLVTGGSDFHGPSRKDRILGIGGAGKPIPDEWLAPFVPEKTATS